MLVNFIWITWLALNKLLEEIHGDAALPAWPFSIFLNGKKQHQVNQLSKYLQHELKYRKSQDSNVFSKIYFLKR